MPSRLSTFLGSIYTRRTTRLRRLRNSRVPAGYARSESEQTHAAVIASCTHRRYDQRMSDSIQRRRVRLVQEVRNPRHHRGMSAWTRRDASWPKGTVFVVVDDGMGGCHKIEREGKCDFMGHRHPSYASILAKVEDAPPKTFDEVMGMHCDVHTSGPGAVAVLRRMVATKTLSLRKLKTLLEAVDE